MLYSSFITKVIERIHPNYAKNSYSQCGEDLIVSFIMERLNIKRPSYLDLGAHRPIFISNTYLFYKGGSRGVCVEADPTLCVDFRKKRPKDILLNIGVGTKKGKLPFYIMTARSLNTFSLEEAEKIAAGNIHGKQNIEKIVEIDLIPVNEIVKQYCPKEIDFVSLDIEGLDFEILKTFDFTKNRPKIWCIETLGFDEKGREYKEQEIIDYMDKKGYFVYADTNINSIFVDKKLMKR